ncbi:hypothetical protein J2847_005824 [Azospirillum agricola]|uniref:hypothetical protein n=1 Tax=Azospirillum agricola TaxID=1720247 RepID=UPI001AE394C8|nr:hypothetical protein [Azospirillum agricola]MBP2232495.1 hypothetical protein [Azospirillum agricola]
MAATFEDIGLDLFIEHFLDGVVIPNHYKKKKKEKLTSIRESDLLPIALSNGRAAFSARVEAGEQVWNVSFTQHNLRVWVNKNWNTEAPTVEGPAVRSSIAKVLEEIRVKQFMSPEQSTWLLQSFWNGEESAAGPNLVGGNLPGWFEELADQSLIVPALGMLRWCLTVEGSEVFEILHRSVRRHDAPT